MMFPASDRIWVTLTDGSVVAATSYLADANEAKAATARMGIVSLPRASVDHVRFRPAPPALQKRWQEILEEDADQDLLVIGTGESLDYLAGIVRSAREQEIDFDLDGEVLPVRRGKVFGIRYYRPQRQEGREPKESQGGRLRWTLRSEGTPNLLFSR